MSRQPGPAKPAPEEHPAPPSELVDGPVVRPPAPSLGELGIAGISRRRVALAALALVAAWVVVGFAGQAAEAADASERLAREVAATEAAIARTEALRAELRLVQEERWIRQQARAYQLGSRKERPIALAPDAPPLPADAPGSAARRLGAEPVQRSPLEAWLAVLFGPADR